MSDDPRLTAAREAWNNSYHESLGNRISGMIAAIDAADPRWGPVTEDEAIKAADRFWNNGRAREDAVDQALTAFLAARRGSALDAPRPMAAEATTEEVTRAWDIYTNSPENGHGSMRAALNAVLAGRAAAVPVVTDEMRDAGIDAYVGYTTWRDCEPGDSAFVRNNMRRALEAALCTPPLYETVIATQGPEFVGGLPGPEPDLAARVEAVEKSSKRMEQRAETLGAWGDQVNKRLHALEGRVTPTNREDIRALAVRMSEWEDWRNKVEAVWNAPSPATAAWMLRCEHVRRCQNAGRCLGPDDCPHAGKTLS